MLGAVAFGAVVLVVIAHHLDFFAANTTELMLGPRIARSIAVVALGFGAAALVLRVALWRLPFWVVCAALVPVAYVAFLYHEINTLIGLDFEPPDDPLLRQLVQEERTQYAAAALAEQRLATWALLIVAVYAGTLAFIRSVTALWAFAVGAGALVVVAAVNVALRAEPAAPAVRAAESAGASAALPLKATPNIYWLIADGYPAFDLLERDFGLDSAAFVAYLQERGFVVNRRTWANYPATVYSVAATASGRYVVDPSTDASAVRDLARYRDMVRGKNELVRTLRASGYRYVHFSSGYEVLTMCAGFEDRCLVGHHRLDEIDVALLRRTPAMDALAAWHRRFPDTLPPYAMSSFDAVIGKLPQLFETPAPRMMYAHVVAPHPPLRLGADCTQRQVSFDLRGWNASQRGAFADQVRCVNRQLEQLIDRLLADDRDAVIVLQSDHGSAFGGQFAPQAALEWSAGEIEERFRVLNAIRVPAQCRDHVRAMRSLVNTFPIVLACLAGVPPRLQPDRLLLAPYENHPAFGRVTELSLPKGP